MKRKPGQEDSSIGEMMLAKTVLEEKNELLESMDRQIRELAARARRLGEEAAALRAEGQRAAAGREEELQAARQDGAREVVESVVDLLADWGEAEPALSARLLAMLGEKHGLEVIDQVQGRIDPRLHRVLEVQHEREPGTEVLARGYRLGDRVLRPAFVRVSLATDGPPSA